MASANSGTDQAGEIVREQFLAFLNQWSPPDDGPSTSVATQQKDDYLYRLEQMKEAGKTTLPVDFEHLADHDPALADAIEREYYRFEPFVRKAIQNFVREHHPTYVAEENQVKEFWVAFYNLNAVNHLRDLKTEHIGKLMAFSGTVTRTSEVRPELLFGTFTCLECGTIASDVEQQFKFTMPTVCENATCGNKSRWQLQREESKFVDWQRVRIQESSDEVPAGSLPRTMDVILRNDQVEIARAGDKCVFSGSLIVVPDTSVLSGSGDRTEARGASGKGMRGGGGDGMSEGVTGLKALGVRDLTYKLCFLATTVQQADMSFGIANIREEEDGDPMSGLNKEEQDQIIRMKEDPRLYEKLMASIAPTVYGHADVKRAVLLMLFGGVHKSTGEGMNLRGDINVLIVGDPSCAKSQFLKYVSGFVPRAVYTSGKTSSAAGLTATVAKEPETGEFTIEAGALMLADNGICCIDEFDKMDVKDQVAIHEAMEQQTISIAKAGIQATLNARTSILAAANPSGGRYDPSRTFSQNLQLPPAILSRFDLVHVMRDEPDDVNDYKIARHIVNVHQKKKGAIDPPYCTADLQRYIRYARSTKPMISPEAATMLTSAYVQIRSNDANPTRRSAARVTVRQLEAMVRLSEALARLQCKPSVTVHHVKEARRLLQQSQVRVDSPDVALAFEEGDVTMGGPVEEEEAAAGAGAGAGGEGDEGADEGAGGAGEGAPAAEGGAAAVDDDVEAGVAPAKAPPPAKARPAPTVSYEKFAFVKETLAKHFREAEAASHEDDDEAAAARDGGSAGSGGAMTQKALTEWYIDHMADLGKIKTVDEMTDELMLVQRIIGHLIKKEGMLIDLGVPEVEDAAPEGETAEARARRVRDSRLLVISPNYVVQ